MRIINILLLVSFMANTEHTLFKVFKVGVLKIALF